MRYLLDTNVVSDLMRHPQGAVAERIRQVGEADVLTSIVVASELRFGVARRGSPRLAERLEIVLGAMQVAPLDHPADVVYGRLRADLERSGQVIGANDLLIASHARALGCVLVTDNVREFSRVPGLDVENWLRQ